MEKDKKVTALYCRLSKDDGSNSESLSIRTQKAMLMEYATRNGFGNCQYYVDDGYSGTNSDRPAFQELLDDIREGKVATVITKDQSRLGRNPKPLKKRIHRHIADIMAFHDQAHGLRTSRRTFACSGLLLRFFFVQGQTSSFMWCKYGKEWMDSIRFSLFVLLRWLGESFL